MQEKLLTHFLTRQSLAATRRPASVRRRSFIFLRLFLSARLPVLNVGPRRRGLQQRKEPIDLALKVHVREDLNVMRHDFLACSLERGQMSTEGLATLALGGI